MPKTHLRNNRGDGLPVQRRVATPGRELQNGSVAMHKLAARQGNSNVQQLARLAEQIASSRAVVAQRKFANEVSQRAPAMTGPRVQTEARSMADTSGGESLTKPTAQRNRADTTRNRTGMPDGLKHGIETLSGMDLDSVRVHYNSDKPAQLNALAYAQGTDIHLAPGQAHHLPHEGWHVVQQAQGRVAPSRQLKGGSPVNDDAGLESEADRMGDRAAALAGRGARSAADGLSGWPPSPKSKLIPAAPPHASVQLVRTWAEVAPALNGMEDLHRRILGLLSSQGAKNQSTWDAIRLQVDQMIGYFQLQRPSDLHPFETSAGICLSLIDEWKDKHQSRPFFGADAWTSKKQVLNDLKGRLDRLALGNSSGPRGGLSKAAAGALAASAHSGAARSDQANASGFELAVTGEAAAFGVARAAIAADLGRMNSSTKLREAIQADTSVHLLAYAQSVEAVRTQVLNARASGLSIDQNLAKAVQSRALALLRFSEPTGWGYILPGHSRLGRSAVDEHARRILSIRAHFKDYERVLKPQTQERGGVKDVAEEMAGDPLSIGLSFFGL